MKNVETGLEIFARNPEAGLKSSRLGLLCNPSSANREFVHARTIVDALYPGRLKALYSPQHGFYAEKQDNMIESGDLYDTRLQIPVFSLYGKTRRPTREMFDTIDILIVDLPDVGTRVYTFATTVSHCLEAAKKYGKKVVLLDRPNPVGGTIVEGPVLQPECASFVGPYPIPMRHGLTMGELALLYNDHFGIGAELEIVPMRGWRREMLFGNTGLPWLAPSPNLPTPESALVYPGQVIWEGTNVSEGRGTTQPFELFGAPYFDPDKIVEYLGKDYPPGAILREVAFEPTSNKWKGEPCRGFQIHVTEPQAFLSFETSLALLQAVLAIHPDRFDWKSPPYEYEFERRPIDLILGDADLCREIAEGTEIGVLKRNWRQGLEDFERLRRKVFLY